MHAAGVPPDLLQRLGLGRMVWDLAPVKDG